MDISLFLALVSACAPQVDANTARALVALESSFNPYAIGVVGGSLARQPRHRAEALATATALQADGWNFSVGLAQINVRNLRRLGLSVATAFDPCINLTAMQTILGECFLRASSKAKTDSPAPQRALRRALSCYYSGNFATGFRHGYVGRVTAAASHLQPVSLVPKELP
jgi:type IV secretion system protein VirB1